jgi:hypothetical protein
MKPGNNSVRIIHNRVIARIQWMVHWWVLLVQCGRLAPLRVFFLNMAASLDGGVKFMASPLYFEGIVFGYKRVALVVFQAIMRLHMCDFFCNW